jgi:3-deoxy-D-manno-octulosonic-acid transferase
MKRYDIHEPHKSHKAQFWFWVGVVGEVIALVILVNSLS